MTRKLYIVLFALGLSACASQAPLDDAYYWDDIKPTASKPSSKSASAKSASKPAATQQPAVQQPAAQSTPVKPVIEVLNRQDTTITVRIKK